MGDFGASKARAKRGLVNGGAWSTHFKKNYVGDSLRLEFFAFALIDFWALFGEGRWHGVC